MGKIKGTPLKREPLHWQIAANIEEMISTDQLQVGDKLPPERELAELFEVSRPTVREALCLLQQRGLVEMKIGKGTYIKEFISDTVIESIERFSKLSNCSHEDLLTVRYIIEPEIAALAAQNATDDQLAQLEQLVRNIEDKKYYHNAQRFADVDCKFHMKIAEASHNELIIAFTGGLQGGMKRWLISQYNRDHMTESCNIHRCLYEALTMRNPVAAREAMQNHMDMTRRNSQAVLATVDD